MATLQLDVLLKAMLEQGKLSFKQKWPGIQDLATSSFKRLAQTIIDIEKMKFNGTINEEQANLMMSMEKNTFKIVLLSVEGLGILAVEAALNAALKVLRDSVNTAVGFVLL